MEIQKTAYFEWRMSWYIIKCCESYAKFLFSTYFVSGFHALMHFVCHPVHINI